MTLATVIVEYLRQHGTANRVELETHAAAVGYAPASIGPTLWLLKRAGRVQHTQRASRYRPSVYQIRSS